MKYILATVLFLLTISPFYGQQDLSNSLDFDGVNDYVAFRNTGGDFGKVSNFQGGFTCEFWIKDTGTPNLGRAFDFGDSPNDYITFLVNAGGSSLFAYRVGGGVFNHLFVPKVPSNVWTHVACTLDPGGNAKVYYDGVLVGSQSGWPNIDAIFGVSHGYLGKSTYSSETATFKGRLQDLRVWKEARTAQEIMDWKDCQLSGREDNLTAYLKMNEGIAGQLNDTPSYIQNFGVHSFYSPLLYNFNVNGPTSNWVLDSGMPVVPTNNNAVEFHGINEHFTLGNESDFDFTNEYTIEFLMQPNLDNGTAQLAFQKAIPSGVISYYAYFRNGAAQFGHASSPGVFSFIEAPNVFSLNAWNHYAFTAKVENGGLTRKIIVNGTVVAENFFPGETIPQTNGQIVIGPGTYGAMSNIRFWNKAIEASELQKNVNTIYTPGTDGLVSQYTTFNNYTAGLIDHIGGNTGIRNGAPAFSSDPCLVLFDDQPQDTLLANFGQNITLSVSTVGCSTDNFSYQWEKDGIALSGEVGPSLNLNDVQPPDLGRYRIKITACGGTYYSKEAQINVENQGNTLHFDGVDDQLRWSNPSTNTKYGIEAWVRFDENPVMQNIIVHGDQSTDFKNLATRWLRVNEKGYLEHASFSSNGAENPEMKVVTYPEKLVANKWYHIHGFYNSVNNHIALDGVIHANVQPANSVAVANDWNLGGGVEGYAPFKGEMADLRIWDIEGGTINDVILSNNTPNLIYYLTFQEGIANGNNVSPNLVNMVTNHDIGSPVPQIELFNFDLIGDKSNWTGCDNNANTLNVNINSTYIRNGSPYRLVRMDEVLSIGSTVTGVDGTETYQWYKDGKPIPGANASTYSTTADVSDAGKYSLRVDFFNTCPSYSNVLEFSVEGIGQVLNFDGIDDHIIVENFIGYQEFTHEMWVKFEGNPQNMALISGFDPISNSARPYSQLYVDNDGKLACKLDLSTVIRSDNPLMPDRWYHIVARGNPSFGLQLLIDGVIQSETSPNGEPWDGIRQYNIGGRAPTDGPNLVILDPFKGEMDEVRLWDSYRTDFQINFHKDKEFNFASTHPNYYLKFNEGRPDSDNRDFNSTILPSFNSIPLDFETGDVTMYNFDFEGPESNFSNCSPISAPQAFPFQEPNKVFIGHEVNLSSNVSGDTFSLSYQWQKNGVDISGAISADYLIPSFTTSDTGTYNIIVADVCDPPFIDTFDFSQILENCWDDFAYETIVPMNPDTFFHCVSSFSMCLPGDTIAVQNSITYGYCGGTQEYLGEERIYQFTLTDPKVVTAKLQDMDKPLDLFLFSDDCDISNCLGSSTNSNLDDEELQVGVSAGTYYLVIDKLQPNEDDTANYTLIFEFLDSKCVGANPLACGSQVSGNTQAGVNFSDSYCDLDGYTGSEQVYEINLSKAQTLIFDMQNMSEDLDLFLLDSTCFENSCLASSTSGPGLSENIIYGAQAGTYYLIVDGKNGAQGSFDLSFNCEDYFKASYDDNDAYIDLTWSIDKKACVPQDTGVIIKLITPPNTILYEETFNTAALTPDIISGTYRHYVGDDHTQMYALRVSNRLSNATLCNEIDTGRTTPFAAPEIVSISNGTYPDSVRIVWRNHSKLSDQFRLFRDGDQIVNLMDGYTEDSLLITYVDAHDINDTSSIQAASLYNYCIETYSTQLLQTYPLVCANGSTYDVNFQASYGTPIDQVQLTWNDVSPFCTGIQIKRNGIIEKILSPNQTFYNDMEPIFGIESTYALELLLDNQVKMEFEATGYTPPNGKIEGRVISDDGSYPIADVNIELFEETIVNGQTVLQSIQNTSTNFSGSFSFEDVVYGLSSNFIIQASKSGSIFSENDITVTLDEVNPSIQGILFIDEAELNLSVVPSLVDSFFYTSMDAEDLLDLQWEYTYNSADTLFFNLFREGDLIYSASDADGQLINFVDTSGAPGAMYTYTLQVSQIANDTVFLQELSSDILYPLLTPVNNLSVNPGSFDGNTSDIETYNPRIYMVWDSINHPSQNFDGFRIFKNGSLLAQVDKNIEQYVHLSPPGSSATYQIRAFKDINGITYQSSPYPSMPDTVVTNDLWTPVVSGANNREVTLDISALGFQPEFYASDIYDGVLIERKLQSAPEGAYETIGEFSRDYIAATSEEVLISPIFWDQYGIPGAPYDYKLSTFIEIDTSLYKKGAVVQATCPAITPPSNFQALESEGKVALSWEDESTSNGPLSLLFVHYEGYEIRRIDGTDTTLIASIKAGEEGFNDYINNPVYDLFFDAYFNKTFEYIIQSYLDIEGVRYYSSPLSLNAGPTAGSTAEPLPVDLMASNDIPSHIKVCWDWTAAKQSEFVIIRSDSIFLDTLPFTARAYYDYTAPKGEDVKYSIASLHQGQMSARVSIEGSIPTFVTISGRVYNQQTGSGLPGVFIDYSNQVFGPYALNEFVGNTTTDSTGNYEFSGIPNVNGMTLLLNATRINTDFDPSEFVFSSFGASTISLDGGNAYIRDFIDYQVTTDTLSIAVVNAVTATPNSSEMNVRVDWSTDNTNFDGVEVYRANLKIAEILKGQPYTFKDSLGFPSISYAYGVRAFKESPTGRVFTDIKVAGTVFPEIAPVQNLTATGFFNENKMLISWSHPLDNHDSYRVERNGIFQASIPAGSPMMWYDMTGIPGQSYQYEVAAIKGNFVSEEKVVTENYKGVGEVRNLQSYVNNSIPACSGVFTNDNHVLLQWTYTPDAAQGFEIYRDGNLIAEIDSFSLAFGDLPLLPGDTMVVGSQAFYRDYKGIPGTSSTYHVLAYVEREGMRYTSGVEELYLEAVLVYPELAHVSKLDVGPNEVLGAAQILWEYGAQIVDGFEVLRDGTPLDTVFAANESEFAYFDYTGLPNQSYTYAVRPYDRREGVSYFGSIDCDVTIDFPAVPFPQNLSASQGTYTNHIEVTWDFDKLAFVDSFHVENITLGEVKSFNGGRRMFSDIVDEFVEEAYEYRIRSSRAVNGVVEYSDWSNLAIGWAGKQKTGLSSIEALNNINSNYLGYSVAIDGNWAIATAPDGQESLSIFKRENGGWVLHQIIQSPYVQQNRDFGFEVDISGDRFVVSATNLLQAFIYQRQGDTWILAQEINCEFAECPGSLFGVSVALDGDDLVIGAPGTSFGGSGYIYKAQNGYFNLVQVQTGWDWEQSFTNQTDIVRAFEDVDIKDGYLVFSMSIDGLFKYLVSMEKQANGDWDHIELLSNNEISVEPVIRPQNRLSITENAVVYGDFVDSGAGGFYTGRVNVYHLDANKMRTSYENFNFASEMANDHFGFDVSAAWLPSPVNDVLYILVAQLDGGNHPQTTYAGEVHLYAKKNGTWEIVETFSNPRTEHDNLGHSVALTKDALIYGVPFRYDNDRGEVFIKNIIENPMNVEATDGISLDFDPTETTVSWEFSGKDDLVSGFNIYRNGQFLTFRDFATMSLVRPDVFGGSWNDNSGNPGEKYVYSVTTTNVLSGFESGASSDEGYNAPNGKIQGTVLTALGGIAVPGVTVTAVGFVKGERYEYSATTFPNGEYIISNVFFDSDPDSASFYTVSATLDDHIITATPTDIATLNSLNQPVVGIVNFLDETAYVITGQLSQPMVDCSVEGVRVAPVYNGVPSFQDETTTDENGRYSIVINPNDPSLQELRIRVNNVWTEDQDTLLYGYSTTDDTVFTNFFNFPFITEIDFEDTLTYPVSLKVKNTCNDAISQSNWDVRIRTLDGCFDEIFTTDINGNLTADLLPLNYVMKVVAASQTTSVNQQALNYLAGKPISLNLLDLHRDSINTLSRQEIADLAARQFTYHKAPQIEVSGLSDLFCNQPVGVLQQGDTYTLQFDVTEPFNGVNCPVQEGQIKIYNPAAKESFNAIIPYDEILEEFPTYTFTAGDPLQANPYIYGINIDYISDEGDFLGRTVLSVFVEGAVRLPGSDIIVDPSSGNDAVPMPILILRDPPGDRSYSYITGGQTINYTTSVVETNANEQNVFLNTNLVALGAADIGINGNFSTGEGVTDGKSYSSEVTISQTIQTSDDEFFIGRNADIIVGQGLVMTNGIIREYKVGNCDTIDVNEITSISPDAAATTWSYTVEQVEDIITGYQNDSVKIELGQKFIEERGKILSKNDALKKVSAYIKNWQSVLNYHDSNTVPHYRICAEDPPIIPRLFVFNQQAQIDQWQSNLCPLLGTGEGENFQLSQDITWSNATMDMYNAAFFAIDNIAKGNNIGGEWTYPANDNISTILNNPAVSAHINSYGAPVKNITTGGFVQIEESFTSVNSGSSSHEVNYFRSGGFGVSATLSADLTVVVGGFAGAGVGAFAGVFGGVFRELFSKSLTVGSDFQWSFEKTRSSELSITNSVETGYVIFDDDITDQFSMSVIQPVNQNQTAYFDYFGGRTSCPPEPGSISVDAPSIFLVEEDGSLTDNKTLYNVPANEAATFTVQIDNLTPVPSMPDRDTRVFIEQSSNVNGAIVKLAGVNLSVANFEDSLAANSPVELTLTVERGPQFYAYEDIQIFISPTCFEEPREDIFVSVYFDSPCSPVTLTAPSNNWIVNDNDPLVVSMQDYDPDNAIFNQAILQYRRLGINQDWTDVDPLELEQGNYISKDSLQAYNSRLAAGQTPIYDFIWSIPESFADGDYEVRILMECDNGNIITLSNESVGKIARNTLNLFGSPQPSDQVWTMGDEISFSFNLPLNCVDVDNPTFEEENVYIYNETTGDTLDFTMDCYGNQLVFLLDDPMATFDGHFLTVSVDNVVSTNGNISEKFDWTFRVITQQLYWADADTVKFRLYRDASTSYVARINSTESFPVNGIQLRGVGGAPLASWITNLVPTANSTFSVPPITGTDVQLTVEANQPLGIYNETIEIGGLSGNIPKLHLQLEILAKPPNWVVNPGDFSTSMNMISNWTYTTEPDTLSTDVSDIISVWAGSEIRGVGNIVQSGDFYASYLTIYGDPSDTDVTPLEFRIWDADLGVEYDGHPVDTDTIFFQANALRGTTPNPEMLEVDSVYDAVQYIILPQAGWNGFSLNTVTQSMDVVHKLRSLKHVSDGDLIVTGNEFRQYSDSLGWFGFGTVDLSEIEITDGYMIYLQNGPDTLRVSGAEDTTSILELTEGWNWIGTPFQNPVELTNNANVNAFELQPDNGEFRINMDFPVEGSTAGFAVYQNGMSMWDDVNLPFIEPHNLYKLFVQNPNGSTLCWGGCSTNAKDNGNSSMNRSFAVQADPNDAGTWILPNYKTEDVMPIIAEIIIGGVPVQDINDKVAFFDADTIVALANIEYVPAVNAYELSLLAEQIDGANFDIRYYDASADSIWVASNNLTFNRDGEGDVFDPYEIIFQNAPCPQTLILTEADDPLNGLYEASQSIEVQGILNVLSNTNVILNAPSVTVKNEINTGSGATVTVQPDGCNN